MTCNVEISSYSLATATHCSSALSARSRTGSEHRARRRSNAFVCKEYSDTLPSSAPTTKKSFYHALISLSFSFVQRPPFLNTVHTAATTAVLPSGQSCMLTGSESEFVSNMRIVSFEPAVTSLLPFGVYARKVGPLGSGLRCECWGLPR